MRTLEELYDFVMSDRNNMKAFVKASGTNQLSAFAEGNGCIASENQIREFFIRKCEGEIPEEELDKVAGGVADLDQMMNWILNCLR